MIPPQLISKRDSSRRRSKRTIVFPLFSGLVIGAAGLYSLSTSYLPSPSETFPLAKTSDAPTDRQLVLLASDGKPFAKRGGCYDTPVTSQELPGHFVDALLATEDRRFYNHFGIDPVGIVRAARTNMQAGRVVQGGSTLTQQLAKISYLSSEKSMDRKVREAIAVLRLELALPKNEIMNRYLSRAYFGEGCFGLRAAAKYYFNKSVSKLGVGESAALVAMLKSPTQLANDHVARRERESVVLNAMVDSGKLEASRREAVRPASFTRHKNNSFGAYYADWMAEKVTPPQNGEHEILFVRTGFDRTLQGIAERSVSNIFKRYTRGRKVTEAALVAMRPDGKVVAMVGGLNYAGSQFNRASQALRQPGSSFKSFVYLTAMQAGAEPEMRVIDEPITIGDWSPKNYSHSFRGVVGLQSAFSSSINTVAVKLVEAVGPNKVAETAQNMGITTKIAHDDPSIALGTSETTLIDLTSAYAAFSADAYPIRPWGVVSLGRNGSRTGAPPSDAGQWRLQGGEKMRELLQATVSYGTGRAARLPIPAFGKTGTSQNYRDAWFVGFAGNLVVGVWVGNDDNTPMNRVTGGSLPALIWRDFMNQARIKDRQFTPHLPSRITAFRAHTPPARDWTLAVAGLRAMDYGYGGYATRYASDSGANFGNAMLFGQPQYFEMPSQGNQWQQGPTRRRGAWNPFGNTE